MKHAKTLAWIALVIAVVALVLNVAQMVATEGDEQRYLERKDFVLGMLALSSGMASLLKRIKAQSGSGTST